MNIVPNIVVMSVSGALSITLGFFTAASTAIISSSAALGVVALLVMYALQWRKLHRVAGLYGLGSQQRQIDENTGGSVVVAKVAVIVTAAILIVSFATLGVNRVMPVVCGFLGGFVIAASSLLCALLWRARITFGKDHDVTEIN